ncbi:predicted protein [Nematostella vectensis]|uniref:BHLH domain-containing protein n=1 Tax=Nematostella vectensis TaxID=45351 RepID=A7SAI0_NEMVE|nr:predicted protein [Nematostella vectensis]|eukprot:XP_001631376.1 predicted protein [Nematostella vectensis]
MTIAENCAVVGNRKSMAKPMNEVKNELKCRKYGLRPRSEEKRDLFRQLANEVKTSPSPVRKRRRSSPRKRHVQATVREKRRLQMSNKAFDALRESLYNFAKTGSRRLTKLETLRLAIEYIKELTQSLNEEAMSGQE